VLIFAYVTYKSVEISDNKKHPHYKVLPADLHPEHEDHMHVKHPDLNILPDDLYDVYCPEDTFEGKLSSLFLFGSLN
jgi:hypothetical protein